MIRVTIDLHVIEETEEAWWISTATAAEFNDVKKLPFIKDSAEAREELRNRGHVTRRLGRSVPVHESIQDYLIGYPCHVEQVVSWPLKIDMSKETPYVNT